jgi:hypothetical protein
MVVSATRLRTPRAVVCAEVSGWGRRAKSSALEEGLPYAARMYIFPLKFIPPSTSFLTVPFIFLRVQINIKYHILTPTCAQTRAGTV